MPNRTSLFAKPASPYYLILGATTILAALGLVMVLSASSVAALNETGNSFAIALRQGLYLALSVLLAWLAMNLRQVLWIPLARTALLVSVVLLVLPQIPGLGKSVGGNTNWIAIGSFTMQPSEFAKFLLIIWCALRLREHDAKVLSSGKNNPLPLVAPGVGLVLLLVLIGKDLGTAFVIGGIVAGVLFISGMPLRYLATLAGIAALGVGALVLTNANRIERFIAFSDPFSERNYMGSGWQQAHSIMGLASGGPLGSGLGSGKQKWGTLPEAHTDFIFAVIGEELGLLGTLAVLALFALLIIAIFRTAVRAENSFDRYVCAGVGCWFSVQVVLNIGTVVSLMPVVGVTLPFISYGGSSLMATFIAIGYVLGVIRRDPAVVAELRERRMIRSARG
jgi:cell division protein FtsW